MQIDRAQRFGVQVSTISYALDQIDVTRKKTDALPRTKYSRDLNVIEHDFRGLKRARMYAGSNSSLTGIIPNYYAG
ncbi:hypothetical protein D3A95_07840 [Thermosynechococcus sichuanensis E542]|uniref:Transposase Synechocystis PCC 6803 domain-containing protein n=1 Tax=Thermosynechococcus sichuanensis E542 TaxID=2016101 RepID=A0A3B7MEI5_9CYAN|nr:hypothetical protein D3A95_07840 [Thermosynechococcus vestitus E542]